MANLDRTVELTVQRSQLGRINRLGSARAGSLHWWAQRLTAIALVPLSLWFIASVMRLEGVDRAGMVAWLHGPVPLTLMLCLIIATFWHMELGLRVVVEDYVHQRGVRLGLLLFQRGLCIVLAVFCIIAVLRLGL